MTDKREQCDWRAEKNLDGNWCQVEKLDRELNKGSRQHGENDEHFIDDLLGDFDEENGNFVQCFTCLSSVIKQGEENQEGVDRIDKGNVFGLSDSVDQVDVFIRLQVDFASFVRPAESQENNDKQNHEVQQCFNRLEIFLTESYL